MEVKDRGSVRLAHPLPGRSAYFDLKGARVWHLPFAVISQHQFPDRIPHYLNPNGDCFFYRVVVRCQAG
jgi:hypothetical protein